MRSSKSNRFPLNGFDVGLAPPNTQSTTTLILNIVQTFEKHVSLNKNGALGIVRSSTHFASCQSNGVVTENEAMTSQSVPRDRRLASPSVKL